MEMKIRESNGTFKVTVTSLAGRELAIYSEISGSLTFEIREMEEIEAEEAVAEASKVADAFELERVPIFKAKEHATAEKVVEVARESAQQSKPNAPSKSAQKSTQQEESEEEFIKRQARNNYVFHRLSDLRRELATAEEVPPYMIFHDKTLWGMVEKMPTDLPEMGNISGVGKSKLEKYGDKFLSALLSA